MDTKTIYPSRRYVSAAKEEAEAAFTAGVKAGKAHIKASDIAAVKAKMDYGFNPANIIGTFGDPMQAEITSLKHTITSLVSNMEIAEAVMTSQSKQIGSMMDILKMIGEGKPRLEIQIAIGDLV